MTAATASLATSINPWEKIPSRIMMTMKKAMKRAFFTLESYIRINNPRGMLEYTGIHDYYPYT